MSEYTLVPFEPTPKMVEAAADAYMLKQCWVLTLTTRIQTKKQAEVCNDIH